MVVLAAGVKRLRELTADKDGIGTEVGNFSRNKEIVGKMETLGMSPETED